MDVPTRPNDTLAQDTRARHPNGVRVHLERLRDAGLVARERERRPRGRPRDTWAISPDAQPGGDPPSAYRVLGRWLVRALADAKAPVRNAEATGRQIGRELASADGEAPPEQRFRSALVALGFQPHGEVVAEERLTYHLGNCPYRDAVAERPQIVCGLSHAPEARAPSGIRPPQHGRRRGLCARSPRAFAREEEIPGTSATEGRW